MRNIGSDVARTQNSIVELHGAIAELEKRLDHYLLPDPPRPVSTAARDEPTGNKSMGLSAVAGQLSSANFELVAARERIANLLRRLDI